MARLPPVPKLEVHVVSLVKVKLQQVEGETEREERNCWRFKIVLCSRTLQQVFCLELCLIILSTDAILYFLDGNDGLGFLAAAQSADDFLGELQKLFLRILELVHAVSGRFTAKISYTIDADDKAQEARVLAMARRSNE